MGYVNRPLHQKFRVPMWNRIQRHAPPHWPKRVREDRWFAPSVSPALPNQRPSPASIVTRKGLPVVLASSSPLMAGCDDADLSCVIAAGTLLIASSAAAYLYHRKAKQKAYRKGFKQGFNRGEDVGYRDGQAEWFKVGHRFGHDAGIKGGLDAGIRKGMLELFCRCKGVGSIDPYAVGIFGALFNQAYADGDWHTVDEALKHAADQWKDVEINGQLQALVAERANDPAIPMKIIDRAVALRGKGRPLLALFKIAVLRNKYLAPALGGLIFDGSPEEFGGALDFLEKHRAPELQAAFESHVKEGLFGSLLVLAVNRGTAYCKPLAHLIYERGIVDLFCQEDKQGFHEVFDGVLFGMPSSEKASETHDEPAVDTGANCFELLGLVPRDDYAFAEVEQAYRAAIKKHEEHLVSQYGGANVAPLHDDRRRLIEAAFLTLQKPDARARHLQILKDEGLLNDDD